MQALTFSTKAANSTTQAAIALLQSMIAIPSYSKQENRTANLLAEHLQLSGLTVTQKMNNIWVKNKHFNPALPTVLLNSHHDTVKANSSYSRDPFSAAIEEGKLFGLGSNDAGGALVSLLKTFLHFYDKENLKYNLIFCASAEEEISGDNGIAHIISDLGKIDFAIVGEPTSMQMAISEKGLLVLDCAALGKSGHAAREEGENAITAAMKDLVWFQNYQFPNASPTLGPVKMNVTMIQAGTQHNVVPDKCHFVVDVRTTDAYSNTEILEIVKQNVSCEVHARSLRLQPSSISENHPVVEAGKKLGMKTYGSPTLSDQALMPWPSLKLGPGDSARSHIANEFIYINEIEEGINTYIQLLSKILL